MRTINIRCISATKKNVPSFSAKIDPFVNSDFYKDDCGLERSDVHVFAQASNDPELREKIQQYLVENDVKGFDENVSDEDVFKSIESKYLTKQKILSDLGDRISQLRADEAQKAAEKETENV